ncbi:MAG: S8 family serine peptidase, partial [Acidobacteriota bacterium]|nr:S8 family serine peptidase [Acidobacteriota bacterium]
MTVPATAQIIPGRYILLLSDPPVTSRFASKAQLESSAAADYRRQIEARQATIKLELAARHFAVTSSTSVLLNAIFVAAPASRVDELRAISGVADVRPMRKFKARLNRATAVLNGPQAWAALGGLPNAGAGIKIGILDSGIDQNHPVFQDSSLPMPSGFPKYTTGHPEDAAYTNNKVIVARSYVRLLSAGSSSTNPAADDLPDDYSPRDRNGHGTAVASCAAANVTLTPGVSTTGGAITIEGMAPKAYLGNYKIAGSPGVVDFATDETLIDAVEDAVNDGMDVITTSWGSNALTDVAGDPTATAWENAATKTGAVIFAAAGNSGEDSAFLGYNYPGFNTISSPSNAPDVVSVGATENTHVMLPAVSMTSASAPANLKGIPAQPSDTSNYPSTNGASGGPLVDVANLGNDGLACTSLPAYSLLGSIALVMRGTCTFAQKATSVATAGGIGMIVYWADSSTVTPLSGVGANNSTDANFMGPIVAVSNAAGLALKTYIDANPGQQVLIQAGGTEMEAADWSNLYGFSPPIDASQLAGFSSVGPTPDGQMKPDVVAVGGNDIGYFYPSSTDPYIPAPSGIYMATQSYDPNWGSGGEINYSADGYWAADGTSFATPLAAGAGALIQQANAGKKLRGTQIRSLLINQTSQSVTTDDSGIPLDAEWIGAGLVDANASIKGTVTAEPATISFGILNSATLPIAKTINISNVGGSALTLTATAPASSVLVNGAAGSLSNVTIGLSPATLTLAAGASATLTITLSGKTPVASEYSGQILLAANGTTMVRIPYMMIVGDGNPYNVEMVSLGGEGAPGSDLGAAILQVTDQYGAPVTNSPVAFQISPSGGVTLQSVPGEPACTTATASTTCNTDQFGFAYAEVIAGSSARSVTVSSNLAGNSISGTFTIQVPPAVTGASDAAGGLTTVAPGSYVAIYGTGLSNFTDANGTYYNGNSTPTTEATDPLTPNGYA